MTSSSPATAGPRIAGAATALLFLALPFAVLPWLLPFVSPTTIGNDYSVYAIRQQLVLQFSLQNGSFPLFLPGFAGGRSASTATQGQLHHPIAHLAALVPGYWHGAALEIYTALNLLSIGATQYVLHRVLRGIDVAPPTAFLASFLAVYNLRMLDLFRYGASLQSYLGFVLLCAALLHLHARGASLRRAILVVLATALMLCGGHPQIAYLGMLGALLVAVLAPPYLRTLRPGLVPATRSSAGAFAVALGCLALGTLLSAAYLVPFYVEVVGDVARARMGFDWVTQPFGTASPVSLLHSIFKPYWSDVHGSFAGSALFAIPLLVPLAAVVRPVPRSIWALWIACVAILGIALADTLPLYYLLWKYVPGFSSFRVPGRTTMPLPFLLGLLLVWVLDARTERSAANAGRGVRDAAVVLGVVSLLAYVLYALVSWQRFEAMELAPPAVIRDIPVQVSRATFVLGGAGLALFAVYARSRSTAAAALLLAAVVAQEGLVLGFGTWIAPKKPTATYDEIAAQQRDALGFHFAAGAGMGSPALIEHRRRMAPRSSAVDVAQLYWSYELVDSHDAAYFVLRPPAEFVGPRFASAVLEAPRSADHRESRLNRDASGLVDLLTGTFNVLRFGVESSAPGMLRVGYPYSGRWHALVDGEAAPVYRASAAWLGVLVPAGISTIELRYVSHAAEAGMAVSTLVALGLAIVALRRVARPALRRASIALACVAAAAFLAAWQHSLHHGTDLGFSYTWPAPREHRPEPPRDG